MKFKVCRVFLLLVFLVSIFFVQGCNFLNPRVGTIKINFDLSKLVNISRSSDLHENFEYELKISVYNAESYNDEIEITNLELLSESSNKVNPSGIVKVSLEVPVDYYIILVANLYKIDNENVDKEPIYAGKSEIIKVASNENKVHIKLFKIKKDVFIVNFDSLGGSSVISQNVESGEKSMIPENPTKIGYKFEGWYTSTNDGVTLQSKFDFETPITSNITLYAQWKANTYEVRFEKNAEKASGEMDSQNFVYDIKQGLTKNSFINQGYKFSSWNTSPDGDGTTYNDEQEVKNLSQEDVTIIILYAQWVLEGNYLISYNLNEGTNSLENPTSYTIETETIILKNPTKEGYTFVSWQDEQGNIVKEIPTGTTGDITLYAQWKANTYEVRFEKNAEKASGEMDSQNFVYDIKQGLTKNSFINQGYKFSSWNTSPDGDGTTYNDEQEVKNLSQEDGTIIILYAQWDIENYLIIYNLNGGHNNSENPTDYNVETETIILKNPTKEGCSFVGWYTDEDFTTQIIEIPTGTTETISVYAKWDVVLNGDIDFDNVNEVNIYETSMSNGNTDKLVFETKIGDTIITPESFSLVIYINGELIFSSDDNPNEIRFTQDNKYELDWSTDWPIIEKYQVVISFVYNGITYSETIYVQDASVTY